MTAHTYTTKDSKFIINSLGETFMVGDDGGEFLSPSVNLLDVEVGLWETIEQAIDREFARNLGEIVRDSIDYILFQAWAHVQKLEYDFRFTGVRDHSRTPNLIMTIEPQTDGPDQLDRLRNVADMLHGVLLENEIFDGETYSHVLDFDVWGKSFMEIAALQVRVLELLETVVYK